MREWLSGVLGLAMLMGTAARADDWSHRQLQSDSGVQIRLDYQTRYVTHDVTCYKCSNEVETLNFWANIAHPALSADDQVRLVLLNRPVAGSNYKVRAYEIDLSYAEPGRFTAKLPNIQIYSAEYSGANFVFAQEVAVVINGVWLRDPISETSNFGLTLY